MAEQRSGRIVWVDILKFICIMWVMLSHLETATDFFAALYSPFYLNGFFFAAGYVYTYKKGFRAFLAKKFRGLFVPWLVFSVLNIVLSNILSFNEHASLIEELLWNFAQIRGKGDELWFIAALFTVFIPFYFFIGFYEKTCNTYRGRSANGSSESRGGSVSDSSMSRVGSVSDGSVSRGGGENDSSMSRVGSENGSSCLDRDSAASPNNEISGSGYRNNADGTSGACGKRTAVFIVVSFILAYTSWILSSVMDPDLLPWGSSALPWHLEYVFTAGFWMFTGYLFRHRFESIYDRKVTPAMLTGAAAVYLLMRLVPFFLGLGHGNNMVYIGTLYITAGLSIFALIGLCKKIRPSRYVLFIGQNTLLCFALHGKIESVLETVLSKAAGGTYAMILGSAAASSAAAIVLTILISLLLILPIYIINRYLPFLIGRGYRRK